MLSLSRDKTFRAFFVALAFSAAYPDKSYSDTKKLERLKYSMNNFQHELTTCANYFLLLQRCIANSPGRGNTAEKYGEFANAMIIRALEVGKAIGMTEDAMRSRMKMEGDALMDLIKGDCVNISSAMTRYMDRCVTVFNNPDAIIKEYKNRRAP